MHPNNHRSLALPVRVPSRLCCILSTLDRRAVGERYMSRYDDKNTYEFQHHFRKHLSKESADEMWRDPKLEEPSLILQDLMSHPVVQAPDMYGHASTRHPTPPRQM